MSSYYRVRLYNIPTHKEDEITLFCIQHGASGVSESLAFVQPDLTYDPDILPKRTHDLDVFFEKEPTEDFIEKIKKLHPGIQFEIQEEENKDWLTEWKKGFVPFKLAGPYWVVPSWIPTPVAAEHSIIIDPGMAFGTGTHATTKMASYFVHKLCSKLENPNTKSLIDVGTGTAILAMLAKKHGIGSVLGVEIDPEARRVAKENIKLNQMEDIVISEKLIEDIHETFDIVVANIIDGVLVQIKHDLLKLLKPGSHLFLTGILLEREETFFNQFIEDSNLKVLRRIEEDEWVGFWTQA